MNLEGVCRQPPKNKGLCEKQQLRGGQPSCGMQCGGGYLPLKKQCPPPPLIHGPGSGGWSVMVSWGQVSAR